MLIQPMISQRLSRTMAILIVILVPYSVAHADGELQLRDICRVKGLEENTLQGLGLVVGLKGTGDAKLKPTARALARTMQLLGGNISTDAQGFPVLDEIAEANNTALVIVTAEVPPAGAQQGDTLDCTISALSAKSLEGGTLMLTHTSRSSSRSSHRLRFSPRTTEGHQPQFAYRRHDPTRLQNGSNVEKRVCG